MTDIDTVAREMIEMSGKATPGPWDNRPSTAAGNVWVCSRGDPLAEPESPRGWIGRVCKHARLFRMRTDLPRHVSAGNLGDPNWKRQEANAALIVVMRNSIADLSRAVLARGAEIETLRREMIKIAEQGCDGDYDGNCPDNAESRDEWCDRCLIDSALRGAGGTGA